MSMEQSDFTFIDQTDRPQDSDVCILNRWWLVHPELGLLVYKGFSIQCNEHKDIVDRLAKPWTETRFIPVAYIPLRIING